MFFLNRVFGVKYCFMSPEYPLCFLKEEHLKAEVFGVVLFILDDQNRVFTLQEMEKDKDKRTGKYPGKYSVICEKRRSRQEKWAVNMFRAIQEETGISDDNIYKLINFPVGVPERLLETQFTDTSWATVIVLRCKDAEKFMKAINENKLPKENHVLNEVRPVDFLSRSEFEKLDLRIGVRNIMDKFGDDIFGRKV
jgi:hypothetical protein